MKRLPLILIALLNTIFTLAQAPTGLKNSPTVFAEALASKSSNVNWTKDPFDHKLFVENRGQFDSDIISNVKVLYQARLGNVKVYFTANRVIYRYDEYLIPSKSEKEEKEGEYVRPKIHYLSTIWKNTEANIVVEAEEKQTYYYTYPLGNHGSIKANIYKKIIYKNIYSGIDIEYTFPEGNKTGIKYSLIVHPGGDVSKVHLEYKDAKGAHIDANGNLVIISGVGEIIDHAPISYSSDADTVKTSFTLNSKEVSFSIEGLYNKNKTLIIDPWTSNPNFIAPYNKAYDINYDQYGNVYAYGSFQPFQLTKFNASGVQLWTFNATTISRPVNYGDFAVDKLSGTCYLVEGWPGSRVLKINTLGGLIATFTVNTNTLNEMWRAEYNSCTGKIVIGGGGNGAFSANGWAQTCMLDTNMLSMTPVNSLGATTALNDVCFMAQDPTGSVVYMATVWSVNSNFSNKLMALPVPALSPYLYLVPSGYNLKEANFNNYVGPGVWAPGSACPNGMNGMAASPNWLYMYDGATLSKHNKASGSLSLSASINMPKYFDPYGTGDPKYLYQIVNWGGLAADACDNVYVGDKSSLKIYNSALSLLSSIPLADTVYDVLLGQDYSTIYACGMGYVSSIQNSLPPNVTITHTKTPAGCACIGTATPTLLLCGNAPSAMPTYSWNNGQTTQTATGLCKGKYGVNISLGCGTVFQDTVTISGSGGLTLTMAQTDETCNGENSGSATITATSGVSPYTYLWSNGQTTQTSTGLAAGNYKVTVTDDGGCTAIATVTLISASPLVGQFTKDTSNCTACGCKEWIMVTAKGGTGPYSYSWPNGYTHRYQNHLCPGNYAINIKDKNGCSVNVNVTVP